MNQLLSDLQHELRRYKNLADGALSQIDDEAFFRRPGEAVNAVALIVKHLAGNLQSRWTDFLTTDGEKPTRNRDGEFALAPQDSRAHLMQQWETAWATVFQTVGNLKDDDLTKTVTIRGEPHTVAQALLRGLNHVAYHTGQIAYLSRLWNPGGKWLTIAPGQSASHRAAYRRV
jgi:uncharacterized damage-inducible protein DinB